MVKEQYKLLVTFPVDARLHPKWPELGGAQYTVQKFYRINGGSTQLKGVVPDIEMTKSQYVDEMGERFLDNAMPWDKIPSADYLTVANIKPLLANLKSQHQARIANNPEFNYIEEDIKRFNDKKDDQYVVSLNKNERETEQKTNDDRDLKRMNERLNRAGLAPITKLKDLPKGYKQPDAFLDEAVEILLDLIPNYPNLEASKVRGGFLSLDKPIE